MHRDLNQVNTPENKSKSNHCFPNEQRAHFPYLKEVIFIYNPLHIG